MDSDDELVSAPEQEPQLALPLSRKTSNGGHIQSLRERATLSNASTTPLPPSSPLDGSLSPSRMRKKLSNPSLSYQSPVPSRPLYAERRSSNLSQSSNRAVSSPHAARPNAPLSRPRSRQSSSSIFSPSPPAISDSRSWSGKHHADMEEKDMEEKAMITEESVARDHFQKELDAHSKDGSFSRTVVVIRDSCYGHRFSRPRTSKATLGTIVERPERLHACILGASTAYVRIGGRHSGGRFPPRPGMEVPRVPFRIQKTTRSLPLNYPAVTQVHGQKWMDELQIMCDSAEGKLAMNGRELVRPIGYGKDEAGLSLPKLHDGDLYLCSESLDALQGCLGGVCEAVDSVFGSDEAQRAFVCIRPPGHHCSSNFPSGFCWLNNVHVGIAHAANSHGLTHAAIIDFDLHHGDGSQAIAWEHNQKRVGSQAKNASPYSRAPIGYFSLHDVNSYPCEWGDEDKIKNASLCVENAHGQSVWNVHLKPWKNQTEFWRLYHSQYSVLLDKTRIFLRHHTERLQEANKGPTPKAAIFLSAGFDASEWEGAGMQRHKVNVPTGFYAKFTSDIVKLAQEEGLGVNGRIISVLEGGYSDRALTSGVLSHLCGLTIDSDPPGWGGQTTDASLASVMAQQLDMVQTGCQGDQQYDGKDNCSTASSYDPEWWLPSHLEALEALVNPVPIASVKAQDKSAGNYSSPTQASTAKVADPVRQRRSLSAQLASRMSLEAEPALPPPAVEWDVASYSLSRLLIPADRQTLSCRPDELNAEATKIRRERQSAAGRVASESLSLVDQRMQLRDRKAKAPAVPEIVKGAIKADRRRTIAAVGDLSGSEASEQDKRGANVGLAINRPRRRSSATSSILSAFESMRLDDGNGPKSEPQVGLDRSKPAPYQKGFHIATGGATKTSAGPAQKKARPAVTLKSATSKAKTSPRKKTAPSLVSRQPTALYSHAESDEIRSLSNQSHPIESNSSSVKSATQAEADVDAISSSVKKLKINLRVPIPEEYAARERKSAEDKEKQRKPRAWRKPTVAKTPKAAVAKDTTTAMTVSTLPITGNEPFSTGDSRERAPEPVDTISDVVSSSQQQQQQQSIQTPNGLNSAIDYLPLVVHAGAPLQVTVPAPVPIAMEMTTASTGSGAPLEGVLQPAADGPLGDVQHPVIRESDTIAPTNPTNSEASGASSIISESSPLQPSSLASDPITIGITALDASDSSAAHRANTAPGLVKRTKADLPKFSASSLIPFAEKEASLQSLKPSDGTNPHSRVEPMMERSGIATAATATAVSSSRAEDDGQFRSRRINKNPALPVPATATTTNPVQPEPQPKPSHDQLPSQSSSAVEATTATATATTASSSSSTIWDVPETPRIPRHGD